MLGILSSFSVVLLLAESSIYFSSKCFVCVVSNVQKSDVPKNCPQSVAFWNQSRSWLLGACFDWWSSQGYEPVISCLFWIASHLISSEIFAAIILSLILVIPIVEVSMYQGVGCVNSDSRMGVSCLMALLVIWEAQREELSPNFTFILYHNS